MLDPSVTAFDLRHAAHLARLSELAYRDIESPGVRDALAGVGYEAEMVDRGGTQVLALWDERNLVFSFRGTEPTRLADLCADAKICREPGPAGSKIHSGFRQALRVVEADLLRILRHHGSGRARWLTGHSLGGSLAILAAGLATVVLGESLHGVYAFAPARVGNGAWASLYGASVSRSWWIARDLDGVPRLPPRAAGYRHVGGRRFLRDGCLVEGDGPWLLALAGTVDPLRLLVPGSGALEDHAVELYVRDLEALAARE